MSEKRTFEVWRDGAWVDCTMPEIRKGDRFRAFEDAAKTELAGPVSMEGEIARSDPYQREGGVWTIQVGEEP
jgi:hypothetical protein